MKKKKSQPDSKELPLSQGVNKNQLILYTAPGGDVKLDVFLQDETLWLTQAQIAFLFQTDRTVITKHIGNIFSSGELTEESNVQKMHIPPSDKQVKFYNLDVIIAVGYRVNSKRATQFRIWATKALKEYITKGFVLNDERLKQGKRIFGKDYFRELLERVRSIRASERRIYLQITDIFAECSVDYDPHADVTKDFFATIQNTFHFAITGQTAAEIIYAKADKTKPNMGLTTWKHSPTGRVLATDVKTAKNYLEEADIKRLERTVSGFFDYVENVIENNHAFTMAEFAQSVNKFLTFNEYRI